MQFDLSVNMELQTAIKDLVEAQKIEPGIVEAAVEYIHENQPGYLLWHYVYHNEISFLAKDCWKSLYTSVADELTAKEFDRLRFNTLEN